MPTIYNDIYVRDGFSDIGVIPYTGVGGASSPDIIPQRQNQRALSWFGDNYGPPDVGVDVVAGVNNFVYVRGKNLATDAKTGKVFLYCTPSTLLLDVSYWSNNPISTGTAPWAPLVDLNNNLQIAAGGICVGNSPFMLNQRVPTGFHYCLLTRVVTDAHPNPIPVRFADNAAFVSWVRNNPNVAWRNITVIPSTSGAVSQFQYYENLDPVSATYWFTVQGMNFPNLSTVVIQSTTAGNIFSSNGVFGTPPGPQSVLTMQTVPAGFKGTVNVTVTPPQGQAIPSGATLQITYFRQVAAASDHPDLLQYAVPAHAFPFHPQALAEALGGDDIPSIVQLGDCVIQVT